MIDTSQVSIIIPHLGANEEQKFALRQCLTSLEETVPDIQIILACNGTLETPTYLPNKKNIKIIALEEQGQNKAVNAAVATTNTPWILITNDDMIYAPGWFERLVNNIEEEMCVSPQLVEPRNGAPTFQVKFFGGAGGDFDKKGWLDFAEFYPTVGEMRPGFNLPLLIRRDLWDMVGGYDINYDPWGSNGDSDLEYKIKLAGIQPYQNTNCIVYHFSQTSGTFEPRNDEFRFRNYAYFKKKWGFDRTDNRIWEADFDIPTKEQGRIFCPDWEGKYGGAKS